MEANITALLRERKEGERRWTTETVAARRELIAQVQDYGTHIMDVAWKMRCSNEPSDLYGLLLDLLADSEERRTLEDQLRRLSQENDRLRLLRLPDPYVEGSDIPF